MLSSTIFPNASRRRSSRQRLFENLRMLPHAPGVQMQAIPEDAAVQEDSGDEEEEDPNKRISSERSFPRRPRSRASRNVTLEPSAALQSAPTTRG